MTRLDKRTLRVSKAVKNVKQMQYLSHSDIIGSTINDWCSAKPDNETLQIVRASWLNVIMYVNSLELDEWSYAKAYSDLLESKNEEILRLEELVGKLSDENMDNDDSIIR
tara:strand:- start:31 stop:360 length:330 start_codon:yes stop_codon:yes gene_type:complete